MSDKIKAVVILGGCTAGWLAALLLRKNIGENTGLRYRVLENLKLLND